MHDQTLIRHTHLNTLGPQYLNLSSAAMKISNIARRSILRIQRNKHSNLDFIELERSVHGLTLLDEVREVKPLFSLAGITELPYNLLFSGKGICWTYCARTIPIIILEEFVLNSNLNITIIMVNV